MASPRRNAATLRPSTLIEVRRSGRHGRGVFATADLAAGTVVEECPALPFDDEQWEAVDAGGLHGYCYEDPAGGVVLALGYGSLYNHATDPNTGYEVLRRPSRVRLTTQRAVRAGEELTISYGDAESLWFEPR